MKLTKIKRRLNKADLTMHSNGIGCMSAPLFRSLGIEKKPVVFKVDEDDKKKIYLYLTLADDNDIDGIKIDITRKGSVQFSFKSLIKYFDPEAKRVRFNYLKKTHYEGKPYFVFERIQDA